MKYIITKKSGKPFPPPITDNNWKTSVAIDIVINEKDPKHRNAYLLENCSYVNCDLCEIIKILN